jgi:hypothetical protein
LERDQELRLWRKYLRQSLARRRSGVIVGCTGTVAVTAVRILFGDRVPLIACVGLFGLAWMQYVGDWINVRYLERRLASTDHDRGEP